MGCMAMRWHYLQHVPFEGPAYLASWAQRRGYVLTSTELWRNAIFPSRDEYDGLFILGGPMNVYEDDKYPWLAPEKEFIAQAISQRKPVLGVCLGAQLLSVVLGGSVTKNRHKEIGWFPVELTPAGRGCALFRDFTDQSMAFHWHGDRFSIPPRAIHIARSDGCDEQAFVYENHVVGLQFHLETMRENIAALVEHCGEEIVPGSFVQDREAIETGADNLPAAHAQLERLLDALCVAATLREC
jgi:GMP synthase-like glutamine amidotransferase